MRIIIIYRLPDNVFMFSDEILWGYHSNGNDEMCVAEAMLDVF